MTSIYGLFLYHSDYYELEYFIVCSRKIKKLISYKREYQQYPVVYSEKEHLKNLKKEQSHYWIKELEQIK